MRHTEEFICPRRDESVADRRWTAIDTWRVYNGIEFCSFCGSMHPDEFMALVIANEPLGVTTKSYKVYIRDHEKFYYQHFSVKQRKQFVELYNAGKIKFEQHDGRTYGWNEEWPHPFFMSPVPF